MPNKKFKLFIAGFLIGAFIAGAGGLLIIKVSGFSKVETAIGIFKNLAQGIFVKNNGTYKQVTLKFDEPISAASGKSFGKFNQLTFELFRAGTFVIDGTSGFAEQKSGSYRDSAFIRSTEPLPSTYKISVVVGEIDYPLENIEGLPQDPEYSEGPQNENGCYLLSITDEKPTDHHTNIWWHQHRKVVIDVDNNVWGHGMPNPVFMVFFNKENKLRSFDGNNEEWQNDWMSAIHYDSKEWYRIEIEKTRNKYILRVLTEQGKLLKSASVDLDKVWNADDFHEDYFVLGDPHENYYQGSMKIKSISMPVRVK